MNFQIAHDSASFSHIGYGRDCNLEGYTQGKWNLFTAEVMAAKQPSPGAKPASILRFAARLKSLRKKAGFLGEKTELHTSGAKAPADFIGLMPGINPRPTARPRFSAASEAYRGLRCACPGLLSILPTGERNWLFHPSRGGERKWLFHLSRVGKADGRLTLLAVQNTFSADCKIVR
ncbi:MAG: hypothetical protein ABSF70_01265 [Terracidiphilus sp.]